MTNNKRYDLEDRNPKSEIRNPKSETNPKFEIQNSKPADWELVTNNKQYDLEDRTLAFARNVRSFLKRIPRTMSNTEDASQLLRASGSVGANYIEANESLSKKDFLMRIKICRKEAKECGYWLKLLDAGRDPKLAPEKDRLIQESLELTSIFGAILRKSES